MEKPPGSSWKTATLSGVMLCFLARGLKTALMILNPAALIIGGGISKAGDRLFLPLREEINRQMTSWSRARRNIIPAQLGDDSVLYGALVLARQLDVS